MAREFDLSDQVILITGASGQIGSEVADAYVSYGAVVVLTDLDEPAVMRERAQGLTDRHKGSTVLGLQLDVTSQDSVEAAFDAIEKNFGRLDVLVNNAAIDAKFDANQARLEPARFENYPLRLWEQSVGVNLTGLLRVTAAGRTSDAATGRRKHHQRRIVIWTRLPQSVPLRLRVRRRTDVSSQSTTSARNPRFRI